MNTTWEYFCQQVAERTNNEATYLLSNVADPVHPHYLVRMGYSVFSGFTKEARLAITRDTLANELLTGLDGEAITPTSINKAIADEHCSEDDAFINLAAWSLPGEIVARNLLNMTVTSKAHIPSI